MKNFNIATPNADADAAVDKCQKLGAWKVLVESVQAARLMAKRALANGQTAAFYPRGDQQMVSLKVPHRLRMEEVKKAA